MEAKGFAHTEGTLHIPLKLHKGGFAKTLGTIAGLCEASRYC